MLWGERAVYLDPSPNTVDTLAAALAADGRFDEAVITQQRAVDAKPDGLGFRERLQAYQEGQDWTESTSADNSSPSR